MKLFCLFLIVTGTSGCVSVINNTALDDIESTRRQRLTAPVCIDLEVRLFSKDSEQTLAHQMSANDLAQDTRDGLSYFNIFTNCPTSLTQIFLDIEYDDSNVIPVVAGAVIHLASAGLIPIWNTEIEKITVSDQQGQIAIKEIVIKRFSWTPMFYRWHQNQTKSLKEFGIPSFKVERVRQVAMLLTESLRTRGHIK